jgi:hypothetical protein
MKFNGILLIGAAVAAYFLFAKKGENGISVAEDIDVYMGTRISTAGISVRGVDEFGRTTYTTPTGAVATITPTTYTMRTPEQQIAEAAAQIISDASLTAGGLTRDPTRGVLGGGLIVPTHILTGEERDTTQRDAVLALRAQRERELTQVTEHRALGLDAYRAAFRIPDNAKYSDEALMAQSNTRDWVFKWMGTHPYTG